MLSKVQRILKIADKWALRYLTTAMTHEDVANFHWDVELANVDYRDVLEVLHLYEVDWVEDRFVVSRQLGGEQI